MKFASCEHSLRPIIITCVIVISLNPNPSVTHATHTKQSSSNINSHHALYKESSRCKAGPKKNAYGRVRGALPFDRGRHAPQANEGSSEGKRYCGILLFRCMVSLGVSHQHLMFAKASHFYVCYRCSPCKQFTPVLIDFYNAVGKDGGLEVVYISSDSDMKEFNEYFGKMPWVAQPVDAESAQIKNTMAQSLKIAGIPALIIMDVKTGNFITDMARVEVMQAGTDTAKRLEVLNGWKKAEAVPISEATLTGGKGPFSYWDLFLSVLRNPAVLIAFLYFGKKVIKALVEYGKEGDAVNAESEL